MAYCKYCSGIVYDWQRSHDCPKKGIIQINDNSDFLVSAIVGMATDSALLGGILGGDISGGIVGDLLGDLFD